MSIEFQKFRRHWQHQQDLLSTLTKAFVFGCGKSGTTWLMNILNGHDEIVIRGEGSFAYQLVPALKQAFEHFNNHQERFKKSPCTFLQPSDQLFVTRATVDSILVHYLQESGRDIMGLRVIGDKTPQHAATLEMLGQVYPDGRFINIVRDPRDVATSAWFHEGINGERSFDDFIAYFMNKVWLLHVDHARTIGPTLGESFIELRYEDLLVEEVKQVRRVLEHLGVDASDAAMGKCIENGSFEKNSGGRTRGDEKADAFLRKGVAGDWVNHIPYDLAQRCCDPIADSMRAYGYDPACKAAAETAQAKA